MSAPDEPMREAHIKAFVEGLTPELPEAQRDTLVRTWITDRIAASEWVMEGNDIIE